MPTAQDLDQVRAIATLETTVRLEGEATRRQLTAQDQALAELRRGMAGIQSAISGMTDACAAHRAACAEVQEDAREDLRQSLEAEIETRFSTLAPPAGTLPMVVAGEGPMPVPVTRRPPWAVLLVGLVGLVLGALGPQAWGPVVAALARAIGGVP